jgi:outer membrane protein OmpA-like peptidoglycan-associated protein
MGLGCGHTPTRPVALEEARTAYAQAQQDPQVAAYAPVALREAEEAVRRAEQAWEKDKDVREVQNMAAVARRRVEVARAAADKKRAEEEVAQLGAERERVLLEARTREAQRAQEEAERAQRQADQAHQQVHSVTAQNQQLAQELAALKAKETNRGLVVTLGDVLFDVNQATLTPGAMHNLATLVTFLKEHPERHATIEGYTDSTGSPAYNHTLSQRRAEAVQNFLIQNGVDASRITAYGYGEASPVAPNTTEAGRQQNRRVEVVITQ